MKVAFFVSLLLLVTAKRLSPGCSNNSVPNVGKLERSILVQSELGSIPRSFIAYVPEALNFKKPMRMLFMYHGQGGYMQDYYTYFDFVSLSEKHGVILVYLQGMEDGDCGTGWNVNPDPSTCDENASTCCYDSCRLLNQCSNSSTAQCRWATCFDDTAYTLALYNRMINHHCVDLDLVYQTGSSNGGMMAHYNYAHLPTLFRKHLIHCALPLVGHIDVPTFITSQSVLALHGRDDNIIPVNGGRAFGWNYESADDVYSKWATVKGCENNSTPIQTPFDGGDLNLACVEWANCSLGGRVVLCLVDGEHCPIFDDYTEMAWWLMEWSDLTEQLPYPL